MSIMGDGVTIGVLAGMASVNVETVRYYERRGLLDRPPRESGFRKYTDKDLRRLEFIRSAKRVGFTLSEIKALIGAAEAGCADEMLAAVRAKRDQIDRRLHDLMQQRRRLDMLIDGCAFGRPECVFLQVAGL
jgi:DNA-binding transcriptional MerR regulator